MGVRTSNMTKENCFLLLLLFIFVFRGCFGGWRGGGGGVGEHQTTEDDYISSLITSQTHYFARWIHVILGRSILLARFYFSTFYLFVFTPCTKNFYF